ncbi:acyltransferase [Frateuria aurantia]
MLAHLPGWLRIPLVYLLIALSTVVHIVVLAALTLAKILLPLARWRDLCSEGLAAIAESWLGVNNALFHLFTRIDWQISTPPDLQRTRNYLLLCNHQSWIDIPALQFALNRKIPLMRFFLKQQLIWVPLLGPAWWALDFPFMRRYSPATLARHPELKGRDMEITRKACERFRRIPSAIMNFAEGTRFTAAKHAQQHSPYRHLLRPKAGGTAFVLNAMGDVLYSILDITIVYPDGVGSMHDMICGRVRTIRLDIRERPLPQDLSGDYQGDPVYRERFQRWMNALWAEKDARIGQLLARPPQH